MSGIPSVHRCSTIKGGYYFTKDLYQPILRTTTDGLASARARGRVGGRPKGLSPAAQQKASIASALYKEG